MESIEKYGKTELTFNEEQISVLKESIAKDLTLPEFDLFVNVCKRKQLDPFSGQICAVKRFDSSKNKPVMTIQTEIDGYRTIAQRTGRYNGQTMPEWCGSDGIWKEVWLEEKYPLAARIGVYIIGQSEPTYAVALWREFYPGDKMGFMWRKLPTIMLLKCAEAQALRKAFPMDLAGMYVKEEIQNDQIMEVSAEDLRDEKAKRIEKSFEMKSLSEPETAEVIEDGNPFAKMTKPNLLKKAVEILIAFTDNNVELIKQIIFQNTGKTAIKECEKEQLIDLIATLEEAKDNKIDYIDQIVRNQ